MGRGVRAEQQTMEVPRRASRRSRAGRARMSSAWRTDVAGVRRVALRYVPGWSRYTSGPTWNEWRAGRTEGWSGGVTRDAEIVFRERGYRGGPGGPDGPGGPEGRRNRELMAESREIIPIRLRDEGRTATWNPAVTRAGQVLLHVRGENGEVETRRSVNSGRARVRIGEMIESVTSATE